MRRLLVVAGFLFAVASGCQQAKEKPKPAPTAGSGSSSAGAQTQTKSEQIKPPLDLANPPIDAVRTASGLIYKKLTSVDGGSAAKRNDTVMITYTGWRQATPLLRKSALAY